MSLVTLTQRGTGSVIRVPEDAVGFWVVRGFDVNEDYSRYLTASVPAEKPTPSGADEAPKPRKRTPAKRSAAKKSASKPTAVTRRSVKGED